LFDLALVDVECGDAAAARPRLVESLKTFAQLADKWFALLVLQAIAELAALEGRPERALRIAGAATTLRTTMGVRPHPMLLVRLEQWLERARRQLGVAAQARAWAEGRAMSFEQVVAYALAEAPSTRPARLGGGSNGRPPALTAREREVAALIARGLTNREIAARLVVAERTVTTHVEHVMTKLGVHKRAQIASWATEYGLAGARA
jgi:DNA-binding CsgD family transcriptional regulator